MTMDNKQYHTYYSDPSFHRKLAKFAKTAGREVVEKSLYLYYAVQDPATPEWAKAIIYSALGYFIFPLDAVPDFMPGVGFGDDLTALAAAITIVATYVTPEVKRKAKEKTTDWFGRDIRDAVR